MHLHYSIFRYTWKSKFIYDLCLLGVLGEHKLVSDISRNYPIGKAVQIN